MYSCNHMYCKNCNKKTKEICLICNEKKELISFDNHPDDHTLVYEYTSYTPEVRNRINEYYNRINTIMDRQNISDNLLNTNLLNTILYPINDIGANNLFFELSSTPLTSTPLRTPITYRPITSSAINTSLINIDPSTIILFR